MKESLVAKKSVEFSLRVIKLYRFLQDEKREFVMSNQLLRSGTSIGANIAESKYAQSSSDFIHKLSIALKEASDPQAARAASWIKYLAEPTAKQLILIIGLSCLKKATMLLKNK